MPTPDDQTDLPIDDDPPAELDPMGVSQGQGDQGAIRSLADREHGLQGWPRGGPEQPA